MNHSESNWIELLKLKDADAARELWTRYFDRLMGIARRKLGGAARRVADEEDVVLSAFHSFCRGAASDRFQKLDDRNDLWQILAMLISRKAARQIQKELAAKRGGGGVRGGSAFIHGDESWSSGFQNAVTGGPSPEFAAIADEEFERLLNLLPDDSLRTITLAKLEGFTNAEIADQISRNERSVERKLQMIRRHWEDDQPESW